MKNFISLYLLTSLCFVSFVNAQAIPIDPNVVSTLSYSPEEACILELKKIAEPRFGISFDSLQKRNGSGNKSSDPFSVQSYNDFIGYSKLPVPIGSDSLMSQYPNNMDKLSANKKSKGNKVYKANKTHIAPILHTDGTNTSVGTYEGNKQYIDGYYVDTRVLTFGERMPNFFFPVKNRKQVQSSSGNIFPTGIGYDDFREYVLYTHHISKDKESNPAKRFLSCGIVKTVPENGHVKVLDVDNYFGNSFIGSSYLVDDEAPIVTNDNHSFVKAEVAIQAVKDADWTKYFQFQVLALAYDNGSAFLNETVTFPLQEQAMTDPALQAEGDMRKTIVNFLDLNAKDAIVQGVEQGLVEAETVAKLGLRSLQASTFNSSALPSKTGGMALEGGVKYDVYKEVEAISDPVLRSYMETALVPGYEDVFDGMDADTMPPLFKAIQECPLTFEQKLENVEYALQKADGGANITPKNIEYKHLNFGECVVPFEDARVQALRAENIYTSALSGVINQQLEVDITDPANISIADLQAMEANAVVFEKEKQAKKKAYENASVTYNTCGRALLEEKVSFNRGDIDQSDFDTKTTVIADRCNESLQQIMADIKSDDSVFFSFENDVEAQLLTKDPVVETKTVIETEVPEPIPTQVVPEVEKKDWWQQQYIYFVISGILALFGFIALLVGMMNKKNN